MNTLKTLCIISITLFAFSNCDLLNLGQRETLDDLLYELSSSEAATYENEDRGRINDERRKGKYLCQKSCSDSIPEAYEICKEKFKECKESGQMQCGKVFRKCASEVNVTLADWMDFKTCKQDCRETVAVCKEPFRACKLACGEDKTCIEGCITTQLACFKDNVCEDYPLFCEETGDCLEQ